MIQSLPEAARTLKPRQWLALSGVAGLAASLLVGAGEFALHFNPLGGYEDPHYRFWLSIDETRLDVGHWLTVFAAPLYLVGYWHLAEMLKPASRLFGWIFFLVGAYSFVVGAVWIGQRPFLAWVAQAVAKGEASPVLLSALADRNAVLINFLRAAVAFNSLIWIVLVASGRTWYPRWGVVFAPGILLALVFASNVWLRPFGLFLAPSAMNVAHGGLFLMSVLRSFSVRS